MELYEVEVNKNILGNSKHIMTLEKISKFNLVAKSLALLCNKDGLEHASGMWTVRLYKGNLNDNKT